MLSYTSMDQLVITVKLFYFHYDKQFGKLASVQGYACAREHAQ
jgi:hypothetical protein